MNLNYNLARLDNAMGRRPEALEYGLRRVEWQADFGVAYDPVGSVLFKAGVLEDSAGFF